MMNKAKCFSLTLISAALSASLVGCGGGSGGGGGSSADSVASLRILQASAFAPAVDVLVNDAVVASDLNFMADTAYISITGGRATVQLREHGTSTILASRTATFNGDGSYSMIVHNYAEDLSIKLINDTSARANSSTDMRLVNVRLTDDAGEEQDAIDVFTDTDTDNLTSADVAANNLAYGADALISNVTGTQLLTLTESSHMDNDAPLNELLYSSGDLTLSGDTTVVITNPDEGFSSATVLLWNASGVTEVQDNVAAYQVLNLIDDQEINVYANGSTIATNVAYEDDVSYRLVAPGSLSITVSTSSGGANDAIADYTTNLTLSRGDYYTLIAAGDQLNEGQMIVLNSRTLRREENTVQVRYVNASYSSSVNPSDVYLYTGIDGRPATPTDEDFAVGSASEYVAVPLTYFTLEFDTPDTTTVQAAPFNNILLSPYAAYTGIVYGNAGGVYTWQLNDSRPARNNAGK